MSNTIELRPLTAAQTDLAARLAAGNYRMERQAVPVLPDRDEAFFRERLSGMLTDGTGLAAYEAGEPVGFLAFGGVFENGEGGIRSVVSPVFGYGIRHERRGKILSLLFQALAASLCENRVQSFRVSAYAHDAQVLREYSMLSFSMQHMDLVRSADWPIEADDTGRYSFREVLKPELPRHREVIIRLYRSLINHLRRSPVFYHCSYFLPVENRFDDFLEEGIRVFGVFEGEALVGMISAEKTDGELSEADPEALGMGDVFILPEHRGQGLSAALLRYAGDRLRESGARRLYVMHGTINPMARGFWDKHFTNYSYSMERSINPHMLGTIESV